jgi:Mn2+/Fe2+ NRAMP family transporter
MKQISIYRFIKGLGPAIITACLVLGPGSLLVSSNVGSQYGYSMLWVLIFTGILMGTYLTMAVRIGVIGQQTPCTLIAGKIGRSFAMMVGLNLCLICSTFQFSNNLAFTAAIGTLFPKIPFWMAPVTLNVLIILLLLFTSNLYRFLERLMKGMVGIMLICFLANLVVARPDMTQIAKGLVPIRLTEISFELPKKMDGIVRDPMILIASLIGTTFSLAGAFYQGNLVREKGWTKNELSRGIGDGIVGVIVLTLISGIIMITTATVIPNQSASDIGVLAQSLEPLLGSVAYIFFCVGLLAVSMNPFLINAMIGGSILADGLGKPPRLSGRWPRFFTVIVLLVGMVVAILALKTGQKPVNLIIFGQALTVIGNPLMAIMLLWLANQKEIMKEQTNSWWQNMLAIAGLVVVVFLAFRVIYRIILQFI